MRARTAGVWRWSGGRKLRLLVALVPLGAVAVLAAASHGATRAGVLKLNLDADAARTRVVIELDRPTTGRLVSRPGARQLELALVGVGIAGPMHGEGAGLVRGWSATERGGGARLRFDLTGRTVVQRRFLTPPGDGTTVYRYVIDFAPAPEAQPSAHAGGGWFPGLGRASAAGTPPKVIVIDAGHGGKDPGAAGVTTREKAVTLAAARLLRDRLQQSGRYQVVMTREDDRYLPLTERVQAARRANADLFLSLHADSDPDRSIRGATAYTLSDRGAKLVASRMFEQADWFIDMHLPGQQQQVNRILLDLSQRQTKDRSSAFAETLLQHIGDQTPLLRRSHRGAGFVVLLAPDVPAVLLEMGFITNRQDERQLADPVRRARLMEGVAQAIDSYFGERPQIAAR